jgi:hypothetical protein
LSGLDEAIAAALKCLDDFTAAFNAAFDLPGIRLASSRLTMVAGFESTCVATQQDGRWDIKIRSSFAP